MPCARRVRYTVIGVIMLVQSLIRMVPSSFSITRVSYHFEPKVVPCARRVRNTVRLNQSVTDAPWNPCRTRLNQTFIKTIDIQFGGNHFLFFSYLLCRINPDTISFGELPARSHKNTETEGIRKRWEKINSL